MPAQFGRTVRGHLVGRRVDGMAAPLAAGEPRDRGPEAASEGTVISTSSLGGLVDSLLQGKFSEDRGVRFGDGSFYLPTLPEVREILEASRADRRTWMAERFDCDDFAYVLKGEMSVHAYETPELRYGLCVGMVWGNFDWVQGYHAVNWFLGSDGVLRFIEPQSDDIYEMDRCTGNISLFVV